MYLSVSREDLLKNSLNTVKYLSESDWAKLFVIHFEGEPGIDEGGVRLKNIPFGVKTVLLIFYTLLLFIIGTSGVVHFGQQRTL